MKQLEASNEQVHSTLKEAEDKIYKIKLELENKELESMKEREKHEGARKEIEVITTFEIDLTKSLKTLGHARYPGLV